MKKCTLFLALAFCFVAQTALAESFNGRGKIDKMYIYPTHMVVFQGQVGPGPAGCTNDGAWVFDWAGATQAVQDRLMATLLSAKAAGRDVEALVSSTECGPEGKKKGTGQIVLY